ncbi:MAG: CDP-diacylglycerol--serine O-phosphatidyltransferase [Cyclobacteriaceae bacterium]|nr:CDP-diacylglycerol--serine O-phosphatidyltransferase [Cyclobacteriaceae bacterium]
MRHLPNLITLGNLFCGCLGIVWAFAGELHLAVYMIWLAAILDFGDGLVARLAGVSSDLGKQLDSLADVVSFGLLPSVILYQLISQYLPNTLWPYIAFLVVLFSALRLAIFNLDEEQTSEFKGMPTPANALLISSFPTIFGQNSEILRLGLESPVFWVVLTVLLAYLLVSKIRLFGLKFKNFGWRDNQFRYIFLLISMLALVIWQITAIPIVVLVYLLLSIWRQYRLS